MTCMKGTLGAKPMAKLKTWKIFETRKILFYIFCFYIYTLFDESKFNNIVKYVVEAAVIWKSVNILIRLKC